MPISWKFVLILLLARSRQEWADREKLYIAQINVLLEQLGGKPKRFTDSQRALLGSLAKSVGRKGLFDISTLVTPDTLLRWYAKVVLSQCRLNIGMLLRSAGVFGQYTMGRRI